jgi:hypothetical protein
MITITINPDLSSHSVTDDGALECYLPSYHPESLVPFASADEVKAYAYAALNRPYFYTRVPTAEQKAQAAADAAQAARDVAKQRRADAVAAITVNVDGMTFDGDEISQGRIARAILAMESAGVPNTPWTLSNNAVAAVTVAQLRAALVKAGLAQTALWGI